MTVGVTTAVDPKDGIRDGVLSEKLAGLAVGLPTSRAALAEPVSPFGLAADESRSRASKMAAMAATRPPFAEPPPLDEAFDLGGFGSGGGGAMESSIPLLSSDTRLGPDGGP